MNNAQTIIAEFGQIIGLEGLSLDEGNCCTLQFDQIVVNIEYLPDSEEFYFYSRIGVVPAHEPTRLRVFTDLLESDCFFRRTSGGVLGVDMGREVIVYTNKIGVGGLSSAHVLGDYVQAFVNLAEEFGQRVQGIAADASPQDGDSPQAPPNAGIRV